MGAYGVSCTVYNANSNTVVMFSGGISIKPSASMDAMRADMGGAACTLGSIYTAAKLKLPINIIGMIDCGKRVYQ